MWLLRFLSTKKANFPAVHTCSSTEAMSSAAAEKASEAGADLNPAKAATENSTETEE